MNGYPFFQTPTQKQYSEHWFRIYTVLFGLLSIFCNSSYFNLSQIKTFGYVRRLVLFFFFLSLFVLKTIYFYLPICSNKQIFLRLSFRNVVFFFMFLKVKKRMQTCEPEQFYLKRNTAGMRETQQRGEMHFVWKSLDFPLVVRWHEQPRSSCSAAALLWTQQLQRSSVTRFTSTGEKN